MLQKQNLSKSTLSSKSTRLNKINFTTLKNLCILFLIAGICRKRYQSELLVAVQPQKPVFNRRKDRFSISELQIQTGSLDRLISDGKTEKGEKTRNSISDRFVNRTDFAGKNLFGLKICHVACFLSFHPILPSCLKCLYLELRKKNLSVSLFFLRLVAEASSCEKEDFLTCTNRSFYALDFSCRFCSKLKNCVDSESPSCGIASYTTCKRALRIDFEVLYVCRIVADDFMQVIVRKLKGKTAIPVVSVRCPKLQIRGNSKK